MANETRYVKRGAVVTARKAEQDETTPGGLAAPAGSWIIQHPSTTDIPVHEVTTEESFNATYESLDTHLPPPRTE